MSIPSFSSFPQRNPKPTPLPQASSFPARPDLENGNDESSRAGPSFSSFPRRPIKDEGQKKDHDAEREGRRGGRDQADTRRKDKRGKNTDLEKNLEEVRDRGRNPDGHLRRRRDRVDESLLVYQIENQPSPTNATSRWGKDKERRRSRSRDRHRNKRRSRSRDRTLPQAQPDPALDTTTLDPRDFYTDTRGDQDILRFGPQRGMRCIPVGSKSSLSSSYI